MKFTRIALPQEEMSDLLDSFAGNPSAARMRARFWFGHRGEFLGLPKPDFESPELCTQRGSTLRVGFQSMTSSS
jgi:hypothetical protein